MSLPSYNVNTDRKVKVLLNGTPVSTSNAQSQYARYLNFTGSGAPTITTNDTLGTYDLTFTSPVIPTSTGASIIGPKTGGLVGGCGGINGGTSGKQIGSGLMDGWLGYGNLEPYADASGSYLNFRTGTSSGNFTEFSSNPVAATVQYAIDFNPNFTTQIKIPSLSSVSIFIGFAGHTPLPTSGPNYINSTTGFAFRYDSSVDTTWKLAYNNTSTNETDQSTGVTVSANTLYTLNLFGDNTNNRWGASINGGTPIYQPTSAVAGSLSKMGFVVHVQTLTSSEKNIWMYYCIGQIDR